MLYFRRITVKKKFSASQIILNMMFILLSLACLLPFALLIMASITDETTIIRNGYSLFPEKYSLYAYQYLRNNLYSIIRSYGITIFVTLVGTAVSLFTIALLAYPLSRKEMPGAKKITFFIVFTMLFNGGLVPTYLVYTQLFDLKNSLWALLIPNLLVRAFYVLLMRTFFKMSIHPSIIESAKIDGAGEIYTFFKIVLPLSVPVLATVGLFQTVNYWNDWFNGMIFLTDSKLFSIQNLLNRILFDIQFLTTNDVSSSAGDAISNIPSETVRMSLAVIGVVPILMAYPFFQKYFVKGLTVGAVKG